MHELLSMLIVFGSPVAILATVFSYKLKKQQIAQGGPGNGNNPGDTARLKAHCDELEARLQTLETIICEGDVNAAARLRTGVEQKLLPHTTPQTPSPTAQEAPPRGTPDTNKDFR